MTSPRGALEKRLHWSVLDRRPPASGGRPPRLAINLKEKYFFSVEGIMKQCVHWWESVTGVDGSSKIFSEPGE